MMSIIQKITASVSLVWCFSVLGMFDRDYGRYESFTIPKNDGSPQDEVYVCTITWQKETYNDYYYCLKGTSYDDDTKTVICIRPALFMQLCVQASKAEKIETKRPFYELIAKVKKGIINKDAPLITMTALDAGHRLLSYIPQGKRHAFVNGKKVLLFVVPHAAKPLLHTIDEHLTMPQEVVTCIADHVDVKALVQNGGTRAYEETDLTEITANYDFTQDAGHHTAVRVAFEELLKKPDGRLTIIRDKKIFEKVFDEYERIPSFSTLCASIEDISTITVPRGRYVKMLKDVSRCIKGRTSLTENEKFKDAGIGLSGYLDDQYLRNYATYRDYKFGVVVLVRHFALPADVCTAILRHINPDLFEYQMPKIDALIMLRVGKAYPNGWIEYPEYPSKIWIQLPPSMIALWKELAPNDAQEKKQ